MATNLATVWVLGDQLSRSLGALASAHPNTHRVLIVESHSKLSSKRWHRQRAHLVITSMRRFAAELSAEGFQVDYRFAESLRSGLRAHESEYQPPIVMATEPASYDGREPLTHLGVQLVRGDQFLCHAEDFAEWAQDRKSLKMEDFYRWQRHRLASGLLLALRHYSEFAMLSMRHYPDLGHMRMQCSPLVGSLRTHSYPRI